MGVFNTDLTDAELRASAVPVSAASLPLPTGAATAALQTQPGVDIGDVTINNASGASAVNIQDGGNSLTVDGTVAISGSVAVTGPLTDTQLRATPVPISAAALPLPSGAATQTTLATVETDLTIINANLTNGNQIVKGMPTAVGQTTMAASLPVTIASNQSTLPVTLTPSTTKTVYVCAAGPVTPPATPTDIITITGSATKTVRIFSIELSTTQTTQSTNTFFLVKRSTANTVGTSTTPTVVPVDSNDAAGTAVVRQYTANPTLGTLVGNVAVQRVFGSVPGATATAGSGYTFDFWQDGAGKGIVLRGTTQVLSINFAGAALPVGFSVSATITWMEE